MRSDATIDEREEAFRAAMPYRWYNEILPTRKQINELRACFELDPLDFDHWRWIFRGADGASE